MYINDRSSFKNDIGLALVDEPVQFDIHVQAMALPSSQGKEPAGNMSSVARDISLKGTGNPRSPGLML